jgi:hypothetical protein
MASDRSQLRGASRFLRPHISSQWPFGPHREVFIVPALCECTGTAGSWSPQFLQPLLHDVARRAGFSPAPPLYAVGTPVNKMGEDNYRVSRFSFEDAAHAPDTYRYRR